jgi:RNA polymerase sigma-70 factor (ECF subfamily)
LFFRKRPNFSEGDLDSVIKACLDKNQGAQRLLIKMFLGYVKSICLRYAANEQEAEEVINDSFLKIFNNINRYDHAKPFKAWLRAITVNTAIDNYRKTKRMERHVDIDEVDAVHPDEDIISKIAAKDILALIQKLSPVYRTVFSLFVIDGYSHREIADMLGIKEGTSKSNLQDARKKLQEMIKTSYPHLYQAYSVKIIKINEN